MRRVAVTALVFSLGVGAGLAMDGSEPRAPDDAEWTSPEFDSPSVTGLPMRAASEALNEAGYDVMVVGSGKVALQELGFEGQLLELEGDRPGPRRYCAASAHRCVPVRA